MRLEKEKGKKMNYFLFLNHPKGEEVYKVNEENEQAARRYFETADLLETEVEIEGKKYQAKIDYEMFGKPSNFDCFNCNINCCADSPSKLKTKTKDFLLNNKEEFEEITHNCEIAEDFGYEEEELLEEIQNEDSGREIIPEIEDATEMCFYAYKKDNKTTLCSIHSMCLSKGMTNKEICSIKPLVCSLWPMEILAEDDNSMLYITFPDDFTNSFTIEDYYQIPCLNEEFTQSGFFRRKNPEGFTGEYKPVIETYKETIINCLGESVYEKIKSKLSL